MEIDIDIFIYKERIVFVLIVVFFNLFYLVECLLGIGVGLKVVIFLC